MYTMVEPSQAVVDLLNTCAHAFRCKICNAPMATATDPVLVPNGIGVTATCCSKQCATTFQAARKIQRREHPDLALFFGEQGALEKGQIGYVMDFRDGMTPAKWFRSYTATMEYNVGDGVTMADAPKKFLRIPGEFDWREVGVEDWSPPITDEEAGTWHKAMHSFQPTLGGNTLTGGQGSTWNSLDTISALSGTINMVGDLKVDGSLTVGGNTLTGGQIEQLQGLLKLYRKV